jgi:hypothetical protein
MPGRVAGRSSAAGVHDGRERSCFINQYVVDTRTSRPPGSAPTRSPTPGPTLPDRTRPDGAIPGRWWTHYLNSNADMREYAAKRGVPASPGETTLEIADGVLTATTSADGVPLILTRARVGDPFNAGLVQPWEVLGFEFLEPGHPIWALRPAEPLQVTWGVYSTNASFCYPGGEGPLA